MKEIKIEPEQLEELMKLCAEYSTMSDMLTGDDIYRECMKQRAERARLSTIKAGGRLHE